VDASPLTLRERVWQRRNRLRNRFSSLTAGEPQESPAPDLVPRRKATLADVAERAGVSTSTASRALNGHAGLAPATRAAIQDAAAKLNFQPSALARSLRTQQTFTVGFVVPDVSSPFYAAALKGAQGRLEQSGYRVMLMDASLDVDRELAALETLLSHQVDGLLVASTGMPRSLFDGAVDSAATPTIFFDGVVAGTGQGAVTLDNEGGIALLVDHLVEHGHERIALLAGSQRESAGAARLHAFSAAMAAHGMTPDDRHVKVCAWEIADGRRAALELLADPEPATAVLASSAELALGFMSAAATRGVRLPEDVALVAFDDPYFGDLLEPSLTAVAYDTRLIGATAAELLVEAMRSETEAREVRVPVTLVCRRSCGCRPETSR
jgi:LacI family transcriptional regulator